MRTIRFRTCQAIGIGTGIAIASGYPPSINPSPIHAIEGMSKPRRLNLTVAPSAPLHKSAISNTPQLALSTPYVAGFHTTTSQIALEAHLRSDTTPYSAPTSRKPRSSTKHPWTWLPSLFFLGFALGIIRRVKMSLTSSNNDSHSNMTTDSYRSNASDYRDSGDFSKGDKGK